jgi:hypothetical protein
MWRVRLSATAATVLMNIVIAFSPLGPPQQRSNDVEETDKTDRPSTSRQRNRDAKNSGPPRTLARRICAINTDAYSVPDIDSCFGVPPEALSTRCGGQGVTIFFGIAKPVRSPQIGPVRAP